MTVPKRNGFTLVEMVITLTTLAILAAVAGPYLSNGARAYNDAASAIDTLSNLRSSSERLVREIREINNNGAYEILTPITSPNSTLGFRKLDTETVTIDSSAAQLRLAYASINGATAYTLSDELGSITFNYWQADGVSTANDTSDVAFIEFELVINSAGKTYAQRSLVALRNRP